MKGNVITDKHTVHSMHWGFAAVPLWNCRFPLEHLPNILLSLFQMSSLLTSSWIPAVRSSCATLEWADSSSTPWPTPLWAPALTCLWVIKDTLLLSCCSHSHKHLQFLFQSVTDVSLRQQDTHKLTGTVYTFISSMKISFKHQLC